MREDRKAVEDDDNDEEYQSNPGSIGLETALENQILVAVDALGYECGPEAEVCNQDGDPGEKAGDGGEGLEPVEDGGSARGDGHVGQEADASCDQDTPNWHTGSVEC